VVHVSPITTVATSRAPCGWKAHVRRGAAWCPEGVVGNTAITTSAAFGMMPHTLASVDQSPAYRSRTLSHPRRERSGLDFRCVSHAVIDWLIDWLIILGWDWRFRTADITAGNHGDEWQCRLGIIPELSTRARFQSYHQRYVEEVRVMDERMRILHIHDAWYLYGSLTWCKILRHGISSFIFYSKECLLRFLSPLKILRLCRVLTHDPLGKWQAHYATQATGSRRNLCPVQN
jgi:hypothetical protein